LGNTFHLLQQRKKTLNKRSGKYLGRALKLSNNSKGGTNLPMGHGWAQIRAASQGGREGKKKREVSYPELRDAGSTESRGGGV